ncbi:ABC transporter permease [Candidatus Acetothermia bacterium]|nr:ABC transporter permease [Candidatus Acetothermia bacterium]MCI2427417.1 ABC transporter permease [Candidatus Acetothermia bacterium]MCI2428732.1 ABC transporter permease [Candidatus Acetothermia bacterium]
MAVSQAGRAWRKFKQNRLSIAGGVLFIILILIAIFASYLAPHDPYRVNLRQRLRPYSREFPLGTDTMGRCVLSRLIYGSRVSVTVGFVVVGISIIIGGLIGIIAGYFGGILDSLLMRLVDVVIAFPRFFLLLTIVALFEPSIYNVMIVLGVTGWTGEARIIRSVVLSAREQVYIEAARAVGASNGRIMVRHILPSTVVVVVVMATLGIAGAIITEAALGFFGLGVPAPTPSWGNMLFEGRAVFRRAQWLVIFPGLAIFITVLGINFLGDGLRDALDPRHVLKKK